MNEIHFSKELARRYGKDEAIMLSNLAFWVETNTANRRNIRDGRAWTYNSQSAFAELYDGIFSRRQIQRILKSLEDQGAVLKGNYNTKPMDRTCWYTVCDEVLEYYGIPRPPAEPKSAEPEKSVPSIEPNGAMDSTEPCHAKHETVPPIPDIKPDKKPDNTLSDRGSDGAQEARFKQFWKAYPRKEKRKEALRLWMKLNPDEALFRRIMGGLSAYLESPQWRDEKGGFRKQYIPQPTAWLNGERWEDDIITGGAGNRGGPEPPKRIDPGEGFRYV